VKGRIFDRARTSRAAGLLTVGQRVPPLKAETRALLLDRFREDTERLEAFLDRDLSAWKT
jgi:hypothetical protein